MGDGYNSSTEEEDSELSEGELLTPENILFKEDARKRHTNVQNYVPSRPAKSTSVQSLYPKLPTKGLEHDPRGVVKEGGLRVESTPMTEKRTFHSNATPLFKPISTQNPLHEKFLAMPLHHQDTKDNELDNTSKLRWIMLILISLILLIYFLFILPYSSPTNSAEVSLKNASDLYNLRKDFPAQSMFMWGAIVSGVNTLYTSDPKRPFILLLLVNETMHASTNPRTEDCIAYLVAERIIKQYNLDSAPAVVEASTVNATEYGEVTHDFRNKLLKHKALILKNVQDLSGNMAPSLHVICDQYNPAVPEAVILMTLRSAKTLDSDNQSEFVHRILTEQWKNGVHPDKLPALLTRITTMVVNVAPEPTLPTRCNTLARPSTT